MKLQPDQFDVPTISGLGPGWVSVGGIRHTTSLVLSSRGPRFNWECTNFDSLTPAHFAQLAELAPELVLFGSGLRQRFARPEWMQSLIAHRIGVESMDTAAACRTYNFLAGEGRHVVVALLLETPEGHLQGS